MTLPEGFILDQPQQQPQQQQQIQQPQQTISLDQTQQQPQQQQPQNNAELPEGFVVNPPESKGMSSLRSLVQVVRGGAKAFTFPADIAKSFSRGEFQWAKVEQRLGDVFEKKEGREWTEEERNNFKNEYEEKAKDVLKYFPTQELAEKGLEAIGVPIKAITPFQKKLNLATEAATFAYGSGISGTAKKTGAFIAGAHAPIISSTLQSFGVPENIADSIGLITSGLPAHRAEAVIDEFKSAKIYISQDSGVSEKEASKFLWSNLKKNIWDTGETISEASKNVYKKEASKFLWSNLKKNIWDTGKTISEASKNVYKDVKETGIYFKNKYSEIKEGEKLAQEELNLAGEAVENALKGFKKGEPMGDYAVQELVKSTLPKKPKTEPKDIGNSIAKVGFKSDAEGSKALEQTIPNYLDAERDLNTQEYNEARANSKGITVNPKELVNELMTAEEELRKTGIEGGFSGNIYIANKIRRILNKISITGKNVEDAQATVNKYVLEHGNASGLFTKHGELKNIQYELKVKVNDLIDLAKDLADKRLYTMPFAGKKGLLKKFVFDINKTAKKGIKDNGGDVSLLEKANKRFGEIQDKFNNSSIKPYLSKVVDPVTQYKKVVTSEKGLKRVERILSPTKTGKEITLKMKRDVVENGVSKYIKDPSKIGGHEYDRDIKNIESIVGKDVMKKAIAKLNCLKVKPFHKIRDLSSKQLSGMTKSVEGLKKLKETLKGSPKSKEAYEKIKNNKVNELLAGDEKEIQKRLKDINNKEILEELIGKKETKLLETLIENKDKLEKAQKIIEADKLEGTKNITSLAELAFVLATRSKAGLILKISQIARNPEKLKSLLNVGKIFKRSTVSSINKNNINKMKDK